MTIPPTEHPLLDCSVWWLFIFGVGVRCLFLWMGLAGTSNWRISKGKVPRFLYIFTGSQELTSHKTNNAMKKVLNTVIFMTAILLFGCDSHEPSTSNYVATSSADDIATTSVVLQGIVKTDISLFGDVKLGMMISEDKKELSAYEGAMHETDKLMNKIFKVQIDDLSPNTKYYYCAWICLNGNQYEFGSIKNFTTLASNGNSNNSTNQGDSNESTNPYLAHLIGKWVNNRYSTPEYYYFLQDGQGYKEKLVKNDGIERRPITWRLQDSLISITYEDAGYYGETTIDYTIMRCDEDSLKLRYNDYNNITNLTRINNNGTTTIDYRQPPYTSYLRAHGIYYPLTKAIMRCFHSTGTEANEKSICFFGNTGSMKPTGARFMYFTPYYEGINKEWYDGTYDIQSKSDYWIYGGTYTYNNYISSRCNGTLTIKTVGNIKYFDFVLDDKDAVGHFEGTWSYN